MKEKLINNLNEYVSMLDERFGNKKLWEDFLITVAENSDDVFLAKQEVLKNVVDFIGIDNFILAVDILSDSLAEFPKDKVLKAALKIMKDYCNERDMVVKELKEALGELAVPIIRVWKDIVLTPLIGTLDSERAQTMAEKLLEFVADVRAKYVILDVTGVSFIDTIVGGFLLEMVNAVRLLGCDVIMTGIKPDIAHTLVKLGVDFNAVTIKRDLETGLKFAISKIEKGVSV